MKFINGIAQDGEKWRVRLSVRNRVVKGTFLSRQDAEMFRRDAKDFSARTRLIGVMGPSFVYFARDTENGMLKIGISRDPVKRIASLSTGSGRKLELMMTIPGGRVLEWLLHKQLLPSRGVGEWFRPTEETLALLERVRFFAYAEDLRPNPKTGRSTAALRTVRGRSGPSSDAALARSAFDAPRKDGAPPEGIAVGDRSGSAGQAPRQVTS